MVKLTGTFLSLLVVNAPETLRWWPNRAYTQTQADKIIKIIPTAASTCISKATLQGKISNHNRQLWTKAVIHLSMSHNTQIIYSDNINT
jgi:hypothetical protein